MTLHLDTFRPNEFNFSKISFHPTGYIHLTDERGKRYRDGLRGPAFDAMSLPYDLALFVPCKPDLLPSFTKGKYFDLDIELPDDCPPLYFTFSLFNAAQPIATEPGPIIPHPLCFAFPDHPIAVAMTVWPVVRAPEAPIPEWPQAPFHLYRTGA